MKNKKLYNWFTSLPLTQRRELLYHLYWKMKLSQKEIGEKIGCSADTVRKKLIELNVGTDRNRGPNSLIKELKNIPEVIFYVAGAILGDGNFVERKSKKGIEMNVTDKIFAEKVAIALRKLGSNPYVGIKIERKRKRTYYGWRVAVSSVRLFQKLKEIEKNPSLILNSNAGIKFLEGLYEAEGHCYLKKVGRKHYFEISIKMKKRKDILYIVKQLLKNFNIRCTLHEYNDNVTRLRICSQEGVYKFFTLIDPVLKNPRKGTFSAKKENAMKKIGKDVEMERKKWLREWDLLEKKFKNI
jgi:intein-encoded DNA endonuclease-like protein